MASTLYLLRHGKTDLSGKFAGSTDISLNAVGIEQVRTMADVLRKEVFDRVLCSPLRRCRETAELLGLGSEILYEQELREIDFGRWEGREFSEVAENEPNMIDEWVANPEGFCFPDGESRRHFNRRIENVKSMLQALPEKKVLVVTHAGVIRQLICSFLNLPAESYLGFKIREATVATVDCYAEGGVLTGLNLSGDCQWVI